MSDFTIVDAAGNPVSYGRSASRPGSAVGRPAPNFARSSPLAGGATEPRRNLCTGSGGSPYTAGTGDGLNSTSLYSGGGGSLAYAPPSNGAATAATAAVERWSANEALGTASPMRANAPPPVSVSTTTPSRVATPARRNSGSARQPKEPKTISGSTDAKLGGSINPENVYMPLRGLNVEAGDWPDVVPGGLAWPLWQPGPAGRGAMPLTPAQPLLTVAGAVVGVVAGLALQSQEGDGAGVALRAVALPGVLWVQTLQVLSVPLAVLSILSATAAIGWPPPPGTPHLARHPVAAAARVGAAAAVALAATAALATTSATLCSSYFAESDAAAAALAADAAPAADAADGAAPTDAAGGLLALSARLGLPGAWAGVLSGAGPLLALLALAAAAGPGASSIHDGELLLRGAASLYRLLHAVAGWLLRLLPVAACSVAAAAAAAPAGVPAGALLLLKVGAVAVAAPLALELLALVALTAPSAAAADDAPLGGAARRLFAGAGGALAAAATGCSVVALPAAHRAAAELGIGERTARLTLPVGLALCADGRLALRVALVCAAAAAPLGGAEIASTAALIALLTAAGVPAAAVYAAVGVAPGAIALAVVLEGALAAATAALEVTSALLGAAVADRVAGGAWSLGASALRPSDAAADGAEVMI